MALTELGFVPIRPDLPVSQRTPDLDEGTPNAVLSRSRPSRHNLRLNRDRS